MIMKVYKSIIGIELVAFISLVLGGVALLLAYKGHWLGLLFVLPEAAFVVYLFMNTYYTVDGKTLKIKAGMLFNSSVDIDSIRKIAETNNLLSSPAASLDRLEIAYGRFDSVLISPEEKQAFINHMLAINPSIEVHYNAKQK